MQSDRVVPLARKKDEVTALRKILGKIIRHEQQQASRAKSQPNTFGKQLTLF